MSANVIEKKSLANKLNEFLEREDIKSLIGKIQKICFSKYSPLQNRIIFCLTPLLICLCLGFRYHGMYQSSDDMDMRILFEGSVGGVPGNPQEYVIYSSVLYGKILRFLYTFFPSIYWYDIFLYLFISLSLFIITVAVSKNFHQENSLAKILQLGVISYVCAMPFVAPQFTMTAGMLAISGVLAFHIWINRYFKNIIYNFLICFCLIIALIFSSLIRFEACMIIGFFMGILLLPKWWSNDKRAFLKKLYLPLLVLALIVCFRLIHNEIVETTPEYYIENQYNDSVNELINKSNAWDNVYRPWTGVERYTKKLDEHPELDFSWSDLRLIFSSLIVLIKTAGDYEKLNEVTKLLSPDIQRVNSIFAGFRIKDYTSTFFYFVILAILLCLLSFRTWKYYLYCICSFILLIILLNIEFRSLPSRLWYNFAFCVIISMLIYLKLNRTNQTYKKILTILFVIFSIASSFEIIYNETIYSTKPRYHHYKAFKQNYKNLPGEYIYITPYSFNESISKAFSRNDFKNMVWSNGLSLHPAYEEFFRKNGIDYDNFIFELTKKDSKMRLLTHTWVSYDGGWTAPMVAIASWMKDKYNKRVIFIPTYKDDFVYVQALALDPEQEKIAEKYADELIWNTKLPEHIKQALILELYKDYYKNSKNKKEFEDFLDIISAWMFPPSEVNRSTN